MTEVLIGVSAFAAGLFCGSMIVGPKIYSAINGTLEQMSHDLNPRRNPNAG